MIAVTKALHELFELVHPLDSEHVPLIHANGRYLARTVHAKRTQPPFAASAMDGYAAKSADSVSGTKLRVIGEAAAGHGFAGSVGPGQAVRIFTGAPLPTGADRVIIQEDVVREGDFITLGTKLDQKTHVRPAGGDFHAGDPLSPRRLTPSDIALLAAMNIDQIPVIRAPQVAIIATGDELVQPGETPGPDQIIASNSYGLAALLKNLGASPRLLPIAKDNVAALELSFDLAKGSDLIVTIGGASVGDHDLVGEVAQNLGLQRSFYKIAMRPGKPLMAGRMGPAAMIGLPGNPVSAMVCGHIFIAPVIRKMLGLGEASAQQQTAVLAHDLGPNGPREHYMRARYTADGVQVCERQDSALLSVLADANCLAVRPIDDPARPKGSDIDIIPLH